MTETNFDWSDRDDVRYIRYLEDVIHDIVVGEGLHVPKGLEHLFRETNDV